MAVGVKSEWAVPSIESVNELKQMSMLALWKAYSKEMPGRVTHMSSVPPLIIKPEKEVSKTGQVEIASLSDEGSGVNAQDMPDLPDITLIPATPMMLPPATPACISFQDPSVNSSTLATPATPMVSADFISSIS